MDGRWNIGKQISVPSPGELADAVRGGLRLSEAGNSQRDSCKKNVPAGPEVAQTAHARGPNGGQVHVDMEEAGKTHLRL